MGSVNTEAFDQSLRSNARCCSVLLGVKWMATVSTVSCGWIEMGCVKFTIWKWSNQILAEDSYESASQTKNHLIEHSLVLQKIYDVSSITNKSWQINEYFHSNGALWNFFLMDGYAEASFSDWEKIYRNPRRNVDMKEEKLAPNGCGSHFSDGINRRLYYGINRK